MISSLSILNQTVSHLASRRPIVIHLLVPHSIIDVASGIPLLVFRVKLGTVVLGTEVLLLRHDISASLRVSLVPLLN